MPTFPRPRTTGSRLVAVVAGLVLGLAAGGCSASDRVRSVTTTTTAPASAPAAPPVTRLGVCMDWSGSVDDDARTRMREDLAAFVERWVPTEVRDPAGQGGVAGLDLMVRRVLGDGVGAFDVSGEVVAGTIPGIPAVDARPEADDVAAGDAHRRQQRAASEAREAAVAAASDLAGQVRETDMTASGSNIVGCVESIIRAHPGAPVLLVTDLAHRQGADYVAPKLSGLVDVTDVPILAAVACDEPESCANRQGLWTTLIEGAGGSITFIDPTDLSDQLPGFVGGAAVSPADVTP
ncbi:MAG TPA: hypothetical protein VK507_23310 [Iamia sp.]|nr:hypothetical protein [Iamia sp.]